MLQESTNLVTPSLTYVNTRLRRVNKRLQRLRWAADPELWAAERLGDTLWSGQKKILRAVRDHRKTVAVTCHEMGKSYDAAILAAWWIDTHKKGEAYVITTAPTQPQVRIILWHEIARAHSRGKLAGRINQTEWMMQVGEKEESVAIGRKPNDYAPSAFTGKHAPFVLIIVDEGNGVRGPLWDSLDSLMANDASKMLIIGNGDEPSGEMFEACKPGSGFAVISISAFETPNFTGEALPANITRQLIGKTYVEEQRKKWAPRWTWSTDGRCCIPPPDGKLEDTHPFWQSKVLGQFPVQSAAGSLIPLSWIRAAQERTLSPIGVNELGLDVGASDDGDASCCGQRRGPVFRILWEMREPDTMKTTGRLLVSLRETKAERAKVDYIGVGRGVVDRAREQSEPVHPISVGESCTRAACKACGHEWLAVGELPETCPRCRKERTFRPFANLLSQLWWDVRTFFEKNEIDLAPDDEDKELAEQLVTLTWAPNSKGQIQVSYGTGPSPNRADALLFTFADVVEAAVVAQKFYPKF